MRDLKIKREDDTKNNNIEYEKRMKELEEDKQKIIELEKKLIVKIFLINLLNKI